MKKRLVWVAGAAASLVLALYAGSYAACVYSNHISQRIMPGELREAVDNGMKIYAKKTISLPLTKWAKNLTPELGKDVTIVRYSILGAGDLEVLYDASNRVVRVFAACE